ncbi:MAG: OprD family outer membrane porin [Deltaproteobacteria bacterium]|nr:OprD family outer membrane porin [Deltaproteobacteria bacterium]
MGSPVCRILAFAFAFAALLLLLGVSSARAQEVNRGEAPTSSSVEDMNGAIEGGFEDEEVAEPRFPRLSRAIAALPPFLRDTELSFSGRTYYWDHWRSDNTRGTAWAMGGALEYHSGFLFERFRVGAALYTSQPIVAPDSRGGTGLLRPVQEGYTVAGQGYLEMKFWDDNSLKLYRQEVDLPYVNKNDTRMTPNTFEAYLVRGRKSDVRWLRDVSYSAGYIRKVRLRDQDKFIHMSEAAGDSNGNDGMASATFAIKPRENVTIGVTNHFVNDAFNTFYVEGSHFRKVMDDVGLRLEGQYTWQASTGSESSSAGSFDAWNVALRGAASWKGAILTLAGSFTSQEETIQSPWGLWPGYLGLMLSDFDRAGESAVLVGVSYDFKGVGAPGLSAFFNFATGFDAKSALGSSSAKFTDQREVDLTLDYVFEEGFLKGLWLRTRGAWRREEGAPRDDYQLRVILNYDFPIL